MYKERMQEIKLRLEVVKTLLEGIGIYDHPTVECVYLQFRNILELIATASLSANPDANSKLIKEGMRKWHAGDILKAVKAVNKDYYFPTPNRLVAERASAISDVEGYVGEHRDFKGDFLTPEKFTSLYDLCNRNLHTPNPFDKRARPRDRKANDRLLRQAVVWYKRIWNLVCHHFFCFPEDTRIRYVCYLRPDGKFDVATFEEMQGVTAHSSPEEIDAARAKMLASQTDPSA